MGVDFYKVLGLPRDATENQIKKAYHKLALQHHPDKGGDVSKFKQISRAYEVLSDANKRRIFDQYGEEGLGAANENGEMPQGFHPGGARGFAAGGGFPGAGAGGPGGATFHFEGSDPMKIFEQFFGGADPFSGGGFGGGGPGFARHFRASDFGGRGGFGASPFGTPQESPGDVPSMEYTFACTLEETFRGCTKKFRVTRDMPGGQKDTKEFEVRVEAGFKKGTKIRFPGEGGCQEGYPPNVMGDMVFILDERPHANFRRGEGADLHYTVNISLEQALLGSRLNITHLDGSTFPLDLPSVTQPGKKYRVQGKGMPNRKQPGTFGDLYVEPTIVFPKTLSAEQTALIRQARLSG